MNKYQHNIKGVMVDVYDVLKSFGVHCPAVQHAIKKLLMPGNRGHKDRLTDLKEAALSIERAIELATPTPEPLFPVIPGVECAPVAGVPKSELKRLACKKSTRSGFTRGAFYEYKIRASEEGAIYCMKNDKGEEKEFMSHQRSKTLSYIWCYFEQVSE